MLTWIDTHCHLAAPEFYPDVEVVRAYARDQGVKQLVIPCAEVADIPKVQELAHRYSDGYALGIHPLYTGRAADSDLALLAQALDHFRHDPHLVAVGEVGLDYFVQGLDNARQEAFYRAQLRLAQRMDLPVILHVRRSADRLLKGLRELPVSGGIAHAFQGSFQQAHALIDRGFKLGFGGALTFDRALQLRRLVSQLPLEAIVLETDAPDMPPHWLYRTAGERAVGQAQGRNSPAQLPRIAQMVADLRAISIEELALQTRKNAHTALPRLSALWCDGD